MEPLDDESCAAVDGAIQDWRQGDCVVTEQWFAFRTDVARPLTADGAVAAREGVDTAESSVFGFMVLTQTCDVVRKCQERPFVEVCPLVEVDEAQHREIERCRRPNYAFVPALVDRRLVADLDRVMTIEKGALAGWTRVAGWQKDAEGRRLALSLARKRVRTAFPEEFVGFALPLMRKLSSKHDRESEEGRALRALREIRVRAEPSWHAPQASLMFWFIRHEDEPAFENEGWDHYLTKWEQHVRPNEQFVEVNAVVVTLDDMTARDYVESDPLDLDYLTSRGS